MIVCICYRRLADQPFLDGFAPRREEAGSSSDVDVRDKQPFVAVWLITEQRSVGPHDRRSGRRPSARTVYTCEIAGILGGATQHGLLVERVRGVGKTRGHVTAGLAFVEMRVEHDLCATSGCPADRLRIAPTLMADRDTKCERTGLENPPPRAERIGALL